jgi:hypothetical protein
MPGAGHFYSANIDQMMREAIEFVLAQGEGDAPGVLDGSLETD